MTHLLDHHRKQLEDSVIAAEVIEKRGYYSATTRAELQRLGFGRAQCNVPGMVIPIYDTQGDLRLYQFRPDTPRVKDGRTIKYETPAKAGLVLDVPRSIRDRLGDPGVPLWITEGSKKVDSALSHGLACIGVVGVYGWRGTNDDGGKTALTDLEYIAWNDRKVYLAFDSDAMEKVEVHQALERFAALLSGRGAKVRYVYIPSTDGRKVGLDDYLAGGGSVDGLLRAATDTLQRLPSAEADGEPGWEPDERELDAARLLLGAPDLLERAGETIRDLGYAGETKIPKLVYLALTSRILPRPQNLVLVGPSSAGKTFTVDLTGRLMPPGAIYRLTASSERALIYTDADLRRCVLILGEMPSIRDTRSVGALILKGITAEGRVTYETVEKTASGMRPLRIDKPGPTGFITTTTGRIDSELDTRVLTVPVSDTREMTREIMRSTAARWNGHALEEPDLGRWHALQWWLANEGNAEVNIPYSNALAAALSDAHVRQRRDTGQLFTLIAASAILHQRQRQRDERGRIIATQADYEIVFDLTADLFGAIQAEGVTPALRETVRSVQMLNNAGEKPTITQVARYMKTDRSAVNRHVLRALDGGYLVNLEERPRRPAKLEVGDAPPEDRPALPLPAELFGDARTPPVDTSDCTPTHYPDYPDSGAEKQCDTPAAHHEHTMHTDAGQCAGCADSVQPPLHTASADSDAENADSVQVCSAEDNEGEHARIEINYERFKRCRDCGGKDWWWNVDDGPKADHCLHCDPRPADARIERKVGTPA